MTDPLTVSSVAAAGVAMLGAAVGLGRSYRVRRGLERDVRIARYQAHHDELTGLLNRAGFRAVAAPAVTTRPTRPGSAVLLIDLDRFKPVNDRHGHTVGDVVLRAVAGRIRAVLGDRGQAARLGGDEFAVLLTGAAEADPGWRAELIAAALRQAITDPIEIDAGCTVRISACVGVAPVTGPTELAVLLGRADTAMYRAKLTATVCGVAVYHPDRDAGRTAGVRTRELTGQDCPLADPAGVRA